MTILVFFLHVFICYYTPPSPSHSYSPVLIYFLSLSIQSATYVEEVFRILFSLGVCMILLNDESIYTLQIPNYIH